MPPIDNYNGIQSTMNRKDRRMFGKKDLQLHTTIRKGKTNPNLYILSPELVKFNQENLQHRMEEENSEMMLNNSLTMENKRHTEKI